LDGAFTNFDGIDLVLYNGSVREAVHLPGQTLTFGLLPFTWEQLYKAQGECVVGFIIEDLDGNQYSVYTQITVR
jgi:hypothetical protein